MIQSYGWRMGKARGEPAPCGVIAVPMRKEWVLSSAQAPACFHDTGRCAREFKVVSLQPGQG